MTIQDWGSIGELLAAIGTIATLGYLAIQIRANTRAARAQSGQARTASSKQQLMALAQDQRLASIFRRGLADLASLEPDEETQFNFLMFSFLSDAQASFTDMKLGIIGDSDFSMAWDGVKVLVGAPGGRAVWNVHGSRFGSREFRAFVDAYLSREVST